MAGAASLVLAAGLGRWISRPFAAGSPRRPAVHGGSLAGLVGVLGVSAAGIVGLAVDRGVARVSRPARAPPSGAKNVLLIVLDTVRAESLSLYGYARDTTPNLARWAKKGVRFDRAIATAPWTLPSHGSFFTGQWPYKLNLHWQTGPRPDDAHAGRVPAVAGIPDRRLRREHQLSAATRSA